MSQRTTYGHRRKSSKKKFHVQTKRLLRVGIAATILVFAGILIWLGVRAQVASAVEKDVLYEGVMIDGVDLSEMTRQEAIDALTTVNKPQLNAVSLRLTKDGIQVAELTAAHIGAKLDIEEQVDLAYAQGRTGTLFECYRRIRDIAKNGYESNTTLIYDETVLDATVQAVKDKVDIPMQEATVAFHPDDATVFTYTEGSTGYEIDGAQLISDIKEGLMSSFNLEINLVLETRTPTTTVDDLRKVTTMVCTAATDLGNSTENRIFNVNKSIRSFNGLMVMPGKQVSFNLTTGERSEANGYKEAPEIMEDKSFGVGFGGGVCQSSSTMYNAVLKAGLQVDARAHHSIPVGYVYKGLDATVSYGYLDMVFTNTSAYPVYIQTFVANHLVNVIIYGAPLEDGMTIKLTSTILEEIPPPEPKLEEDKEGEFVIYKDETYIKIPSYAGYKVRNTRQYWKNGELVKEEQLHDDYYKEIIGTTLVGITDPAERPAPTPDPSATPNPTDGEPSDMPIVEYSITA